MDLEKIKNIFLIKYPFFGNIMANCNFHSTSLIKKSDTDGRNIYYNNEFVDSLSDDEKLYVFAHEIFHIAFDHVKRSKNKDKEIWGIASDAIINGFLKEDGLTLLKDSIEIENSTNYSVDELYELLYLQKINDNYRNKDNKHINTSIHNSCKKNIVGLNDTIFKETDIFNDNHKLWNKEIDYKSCQKSKEKTNDYRGNQELENKINELSNMGEKEAFKQNKIERDNNLNNLLLSLTKQSKGAGNTTNSEIRNTNNIGKKTNIIDWRKLLKEAIKYNIDFSYKNAEIENGVVTPQLEEIPFPETEIVLDTSGSIDHVLLITFLKECKNIIQNSKVYVGCFDTKFYGFKELRDEKDIDKMKFVGGGGTDFNVAVNAFTRRVENKIIFTDGEANMPQKKMDIIWVVFGDKKIKPKGGRVIYINNKEFRKLAIK